MYELIEQEVYHLTPYGMLHEMYEDYYFNLKEENIYGY